MAADRAACSAPVRSPLKTFRPGDEGWLAVDVPAGRCTAVFEDDGETGYFCAVERTEGDLRIVDALHISCVSHVVDRERESSAEGHAEISAERLDVRHERPNGVVATLGAPGAGLPR